MYFVWQTLIQQTKKSERIKKNTLMTGQHSKQLKAYKNRAYTINVANVTELAKMN